MNADNAQLRAEMTKELRSARNALIVVGILMVVFDVLLIQILQRDAWDSTTRNIALSLDVFILGVFLGLAYYVPRKPRLCLTTGLIFFWAIQLFGAYDDPASLMKGIIVKVLFTLALVKGLQSAGKAQVMKRELERVFE